MDKSRVGKQRKIAENLVYKLTGGKIKHLKTGRPCVGKSVDISISHKGDIVVAAAVRHPYKIGVDVEHLKPQLNVRNFFGAVITNDETPLFKEFCEKNNFSLSSGVAAFWSIKESFFKCVDYDLKPAKISILGISKKGNIKFLFSEEIKGVLFKKNLEIYSAKIVFRGKYVFSRTMAKKI